MKQFLLTVLLIAGTVVSAMHLVQTKPEPKKRPRVSQAPVVEVATPELQDYVITVRTAGTVESHNQTNIVSEIAGKIAFISPDFQEGRYFAKGKTLLKIDNTDYLNAIALAKTDIQQRQLTLEDVKNQTALSSSQWKLYSKSRQDSELTALRLKTQSSAAAVNAAKIKLKQAQLDLENTVIEAPYAGRVLSRDVGIGQYVGPGAKLGTVYATDYVEVRLPLTLSQYDLLELEETYLDAKGNTHNKQPEVVFHSRSPGNKYQWLGKIVRSSPVMDEKTRQISVIARINDPFKKPSQGSTIVKIGQFLQAEIKTKTLRNVYILPTTSVRQNREVLLLDNERVKVQPVNVLYSEGDKIIVASSDIPSDATIIITPMAAAKAGDEVRVYDPNQKPRGKSQKGNQTKAQKSDKTDMTKKSAGDNK